MSAAFKKSSTALNFVAYGKEGMALVFLHYFGGSSNTWTQVIDELSGEFHCIAIDLQGFGASPPSGKQSSVSDNAQDVADIMMTLQLKKYVLIGHSMGGKIALSLAARKPSGLEKLVLVAPSPPTPEPMAVGEQAELLAAYNDCAALIKNINNITYRPLSAFGINNLVNDNLRAAETSWSSWIKHGSQEDISLQVSNINVPVLVISGQYDKKLSGNFLYNEFIQLLPVVCFKEISEAGHLLPIEAPVAVAKLIRESVKQS